MLDLPIEVWTAISDFLQSPVLSHVCHAFWSKFQGRHVRCTATDMVPQQLLQCITERTHTLRLQLLGCGDSGVQALLGLKALPSLQLLWLDLGDNGITARGGQALACVLKEALQAPRLHTFCLDLSGNTHLADDAVTAIVSTLRSAVALQRLVVILEQTGLSPGGTQALAQELEKAVKNAPQLHILGLHLGSNDVRAAGTLAVATALKPVVPRLQRLDLNLFDCAMSDDSGVCALASVVRDATALRALCLELDCCGMGSEGAEALVDGLQAPRQLHTLELQVGGGDLGACFVSRLAAVLQEAAPRLQRLVLSLWGTELTCAGVQDLTVSLVRAAALHTFKLECMENPLHDAAAQALAGALLRWPLLSDLQLGLSSTGVTDRGIEALALAIGTAAPRLQALDLALRGLVMVRVGEAALAGLGAAIRGCFPHLRALRLDLRSIRLRKKGPFAQVLLVELRATAPFLHTLCLDLLGVALGPNGARAVVAALGQAPVLHTLKLMLGFGNEAAGDLASWLKGAKTVRTLDLWLERGLLEECGGSPLGERGVLAVAAALQRVTWLRTLDLATGGVDICGHFASSLMLVLRQVRSLRSFSVVHSLSRAEIVKAFRWVPFEVNVW